MANQSFKCSEYWLWLHFPSSPSMLASCKCLGGPAQSSSLLAPKGPSLAGVLKEKWPKQCRSHGRRLYIRGSGPMQDPT